MLSLGWTQIKNKDWDQTFCTNAHSCLGGWYASVNGSIANDVSVERSAPHFQVQAVQGKICFLFQNPSFQVMSLNSVLHVCGSCLLAEAGVTADPTNCSILPPLSQAPDAICSPPSHRSTLSHSLHSQAMSAVMRKTSITLPDIGDDAYKIAEGCTGNQILPVNTERVIQSQVLDLVLNSWCHWNPPFLTDVSPVTFPERLKNQSWLRSILITELWQTEEQEDFYWSPF